MSLVKLALLSACLVACAPGGLSGDPDSLENESSSDDARDDRVVEPSKSEPLWRELERHASVVLAEYFIVGDEPRYRAVAILGPDTEPTAIEWHEAETLEAALEATVAGVRRELELGPFLAVENDIPSNLDVALSALEAGCWSIRLQFHSASAAKYQAAIQIGDGYKAEDSVLTTVSGSTMTEALDAAVARLASH